MGTDPKHYLYFFIFFYIFLSLFLFSFYFNTIPTIFFIIFIKIHQVLYTTFIQVNYHLQPTGQFRKIYLKQFLYFISPSKKIGIFILRPFKNQTPRKKIPHFNSAIRYIIGELKYGNLFLAIWKNQTPRIKIPIF